MHSPIGVIALLLVYYAAYLLWLAFIHQIRGNTRSKENRRSSGITFTTNQGDFFIDQVTQNFKYKPQGESTWKAMPFDAITGIRYAYGQDDASWFEFFLSDWELWDLSSRYHDITNITTVELKLAGGGSLPLVEMRQYEQRELWLGQVTYEFHIRLLKTLGLFHPLEDVTEAWIEDIVSKCSGLGLQLPRV